MKRIISLMLSLIIIVGLVSGAVVSVSAASEMTTSTMGINMIKTFEGFVKWPQMDNGQWTVGYGTGVSGADLERYTAEGITEKEATELLQDYLKSFENSVNGFIDTHKLKLSQQQFDALVSFTYNLGPSWMQSEGTFRNAVINGTTGNDFIYAMAQFGKASGVVVGGLVERRLCEANLYLNGAYSTQPPVNFKYVIYNGNLEGVTPTITIQGYDTTKVAAVKSTAAKTGYRFMGWYTKAEGGSWITSLGANTASNTTLYAHWQNGDGEKNADGSIKGIATEYYGYAAAGAAQNVYKAPNGAKVGTVKGDEKLKVVAEYVDASGKKWGKIDTDKWVNITGGLSATPVYEKAESAIDPMTVTVTTNNVNNRIGPGTNYAKSGTYQKGQKVVLTAIEKGGNYTWGKTEMGWIALNYTDYEVSKELGSADAKKVTAIGTVVKANTVNVRAGAGTSHAKVGTYSRGDEVKITLQKKVGSNTWGLTEKGWICLYYVKTTAVEAGSVPDIELNSGNTGSDSTGSSTGMGTGNGNSTVVSSGKIYNCNTLRIRAGAGTSNAHIGDYAAGTYVDIYETVTVKSEIWGRTDKGWISLRYVKLDAPTTGEGVTGRVYRASSVNLRSGAGTHFPKVGKLTKGTKVEILEYTKVGNATWGRTNQGWISLYYVSLDGSLDILDKKVEVPVTPEVTDPEAGESNATKYTVTAAEAKNGKVTASAASAAMGEKVTVTVTPNANYILDTLVVKDASGAVVSIVNNEFTMPASNVTITATFKVQYNVKINAAENGKVTANVTACAPGTEIILTAAPAAGYELDTLSVVNTTNNTVVTVSGGKFTMPEGNVNVVATFVEATGTIYNVKLNSIVNGTVTASTVSAKENDTVTLTVAADKEYVLDALTVKDAANTPISVYEVSGEENTYTFDMPASNVTIAATFKTKMYAVTINNTTADRGTVSVNPETYAKGATVTLLVEPAYKQYEVKTLTVKAGDKDIEVVKDGENYKFTMPGEAVTVESSFGKIRYALNITKPVGGTITADKETYAMNEVVTVTIKPDTGYSRGEMIIKSGDTAIEPTRSGLVFTFKMPGADVNVEHVFKKLAYELNIKSNSKGVVKADKETYGYQDVVTLTVEPIAGYKLDLIAVKNGTTKLELKQEGENKFSFVMPIPDGEVVVSATYKELPGKYEVTRNGGANFRETASNSGKLLAEIPQGTILQSLEGSDENWAKVTYKGKTGYVSMLTLTKVTN